MDTETSCSVFSHDSFRHGVLLSYNENLKRRTQRGQILITRHFQSINLQSITQETFVSQCC